MKPAWNEILTAHLNSRKFTAFLQGVKVTLPSGETIRLKLERIYPVTVESKLFQLYPFTYCAEMSGLGFSETGYAEAAHPLLAIQKAIAEAVERCLYRALKGSRYGTKTSNGWAAHLSKKRTEKNALMELLERDATLVHSLREIPFIEVSRETFPNWIKVWERRELAFTVFNQVRILASTHGHFPTLSAVLIDRHGFGVVAHATSESIQTALVRAFAEACRLARMALSHRYEAKARFLFSNDSQVPALGPCEQAVAYAHHHPLPAWIFGEEKTWTQMRSIWKSRVRRFWNDPIHYEYISILEGPIYSGYCQSDQVQNLFFGRTIDAERRGDLNMNRLKQVKPEEEISRLPHFVA